RLRAGRCAFAAVGLVFAVALVALLLLVVRLGLVDLPEVEVHVLDHLAGDPGVGILVGDRAVEFAQIARDLAFEPRAPQIDDAPRRGRRRLAGQCLAGQETDRLGHRAFGAFADTLEALPAVLLVEHRRDVGGDAGHAASAERLDPRLLDRLEDRPRQWAAGQAFRVDRVVVILELQRQAVRGAAQLRDLVGR